jgi:hypothetical protein
MDANAVIINILLTGDAAIKTSKQNVVHQKLWLLEECIRLLSEVLLRSS